MIQLLALNEFYMHAKNAKRVAVFEEISAGKLTPTIIYTLLNSHGADGVMLEDLRQDCVHYSFICFEPIASLKVNNDDHSCPLTALRDLQSQLVYSTRAEVAGLITSAVGFITYDAIRYFENIPDRHVADHSLPILLFNFYALSLTFDHEKQTILINTVVEVGDHPEQAYQHARQKIMAVIELLMTSSCEADQPLEKQVTTPVEVDMSDSDFMQVVKKAKDYIIRGDAFQIVISRCFKRNYSVPPFDIYKTLRRVSPAPFMFYFPAESSIIIGASPERLIRVNNKQVTVNPIAGTRKRTGERTDEAIAADLLSDKKELAEHMMLVDLA
jgi:anthranilate synthase component 1